MKIIYIIFLIFIFTNSYSLTTYKFDGMDYITKYKNIINIFDYAINNKENIKVRIKPKKHTLNFPSIINILKFEGKNNFIYDEGSNTLRISLKSRYKNLGVVSNTNNICELKYSYTDKYNPEYPINIIKNKKLEILFKDQVKGVNALVFESFDKSNQVNLNIKNIIFFIQNNKNEVRKFKTGIKESSSQLLNNKNLNIYIFEKIQLDKELEEKITKIEIEYNSSISPFLQNHYLKNEYFYYLYNNFQLVENEISNVRFLKINSDNDFLVFGSKTNERDCIYDKKSSESNLFIVEYNPFKSYELDKLYYSFNQDFITNNKLNFNQNGFGFKDIKTNIFNSNINFNEFKNLNISFNEEFIDLNFNNLPESLILFVKNEYNPSNYVLPLIEIYNNEKLVSSFYLTQNYIDLSDFNLFPEKVRVRLMHPKINRYEISIFGDLKEFDNYFSQNKFINFRIDKDIMNLSPRNYNFTYELKYTGLDNDFCDIFLLDFKELDCLNNNTIYFSKLSSDYVTIMKKVHNYNKMKLSLVYNNFNTLFDKLPVFIDDKKILYIDTFFENSNEFLLRNISINNFNQNSKKEAIGYFSFFDYYFSLDYIKIYE